MWKLQDFCQLMYAISGKKLQSENSNIQRSKNKEEHVQSIELKGPPSSHDTTHCKPQLSLITKIDDHNPVTLGE